MKFTATWNFVPACKQKKWLLKICLFVMFFLIVCSKNFFLLTFLGQQWGIGYRKAYKKGERYGFYSPKAKFKGDELHLMHIYTEIGSVLSKIDAVAQLFPQQYLETFKAKANVEKFIPDFW